jgi:hypothetical protein
MSVGAGLRRIRRESRAEDGQRAPAFVQITVDKSESIADEHRREIIRIYLGLRIIFLLVSLVILLTVPGQLNLNPPPDFIRRLWWAWGLFFLWTIPLAWFTWLSGERWLVVADRLIAISILPDQDGRLHRQDRLSRTFGKHHRKGC